VTEIIARVGKRYRCLAAMHHQWLYGEKAVRVAKRLRLTFECPANHAALRCELIEAERKSEEFWDGKLLDIHVMNLSTAEYSLLTYCSRSGRELAGCPKD